MKGIDNFIFEVLGKWGVVSSITLLVFLVVFRYSNDIFAWIDNRMNANVEYVLSKLEFLFIEFDRTRLLYIMLGMSFGLAGLVLAIFMFFGLWWAGAFCSLIVLLLGWFSPKWIVDFMVQKKIKAYQGQMVDGLQLLANGLRAGQSMPQGLAMVVDELPPPISQEFNYVLQQNKVVAPLEECLDDLVKRIPTEDNEMFVTSVNILHETGGNLAETFDTIVGIIRERVRLQQKIDTYISSSFFQGLIIFLMPFAMAAVYGMSDPNSVKVLVTTPMGILATTIALILDLIGGYVILKIIKIKI